MKHRPTTVGQCLAAILFVALGTVIHGCRDTASVNPVVELASLTVNPGTLQPPFSGGTTQYNVDLSNNITSVTIAAQPAVAEDTVTINGQATTSRVIPLGAAGTTTPVSIVVSESGTNSRTYTVLLVRAGLTGNNSLQNLTLSGGRLTPAFNPNTLTYSADVDDSVSSVMVSATKADPNAVMSGSVTAPAGTATGQATIPLDGPGTSRVVSIAVTAPNGSSKTYTIVVVRGATASNSNLSALTVSPGTLAPGFNGDIQNYNVEVDERTTSVTISATKADPNAVMAGSVTAEAGTATGQSTIPLGGPGTSRVVSITVAAPNGSSKTYTITIERAAQAGNNNLQSLAVSPGSLTPSFNPNTTGYRVNVGSTVTTVTVIAAPQDTNAGMEVNGQGTSPGQAREITLGAAGSSTSIFIRVNPPNGNAKTYTIVVNRASSGNNGNGGGNGNNGNDGGKGNKGGKKNNGKNGDNGDDEDDD